MWTKACEMKGYWMEVRSLDRNDDLWDKTEQKYGGDVFGQSSQARLSSLDTCSDLWWDNLRLSRNMEEVSVDRAVKRDWVRWTGSITCGEIRQGRNMEMSMDSQTRLSSLDRNDDLWWDKAEQKYGEDIYGQSSQARLRSLDRTDDLWWEQSRNLEDIRMDRAV